MAMPRRWPYGYYSYILCFPNGTPYYVGAGKGNRAQPLYKRFNGRCFEKELRKEGKTSIIIITEHLTKEAAFAHENRLILFYGRLDLGTGCLYNRTDGLGSKGRPWSERARISVSASARKRVWTKEQREAASKRMLGNKRSLGLRHSEETKRIISQKGKGRKLSAETRAKMSQAKRDLYARNSC